MRKLLAICSISLSLAACYRTADYRGDGKISDSGFFTYPRYHIDFQSFEFSRPGTHVYRFSSAPSDPLDLQFYLEDRTMKDAPIYEASNTRLVARVIGADGQEVCRAEGTPSARADHERWVLMNSAIDSAFWHRDCVNINASRGAYRLEVVVVSVDPKTPAVFLRPSLEGGGIELP